MSFSVNVPETPEDQFAQAVNAAQIDDTFNVAPLVAQWREQLEAAKAAVLAIFDAHPFGEGGTYSASITGHANHDGAGDGTGYTESEFVHVTINRKPAPVVVPVAPVVEPAAPAD